MKQSRPTRSVSHDDVQFRGAICRFVMTFDGRQTQLNISAEFRQVSFNVISVYCVSMSFQQLNKMRSTSATIGRSGSRSWKGGSSQGLRDESPLVGSRDKTAERSLSPRSWRSCVNFTTMAYSAKKAKECFANLACRRQFLGDRDRL